MLLLFLLVLIIPSCNAQQTLESADITAHNVSEENAILSISKDNMLKTIKDISTSPHPINSEQIKETELYIKNCFMDFGYDNIESQIFEYNDENNEYAIRRSSQLDIYLAPTADQTNVDGVGSNIIATKKAEKDTKKTLIVSAHYDSTENSYGANDNGSGVAIVLELARITESTNLPYNITFVLFSGEEKFMLGSRWYVNALSEEERQNTIGLINIDSVAEKSDLGYLIMLYGDNKAVNIEYTPENYDKLTELYRNNISNLFIDDRFELTMAINSDHYPFARVYIPAISIVQDWQEGLNANSDNDIIQNIDANRLVEVASKIIHAVYNVSY